MKNFILIGAAGYIAPKHMEAIKQTGCNLVSAYDPNDNVGVIDNYFPDADFFTEFERFDRHVYKTSREGLSIDYTTVCSPSYLHDAHVRFGLRNNTDVICEKPLALKPWNVEGLIEIEKESGKKIYNILQLRLHESIIKLKKKIDAGPKNKVYDLDLTYITSRGKWYFASWKGYESKSGGVATNIGIHFFDMLSWIFGEVKENIVHLHTHDRAAGYLGFEKARVRWFLSINKNTLPQHILESGRTSYRSMALEDEEIDFSDGFSNLHTLSYKNILIGKGYGILETLPSIRIAYKIRNQTPIGLKGDYHPLASLPFSKHPFVKAE